MEAQKILEALKKYDELNLKYGLLGENKNVVIEMLASESGGSVSCEAHRPIEELEKEFYNVLMDNVNSFERMKSSTIIWEWVSNNCLKVR